jgi:hypothetical protein
VALIDTARHETWPPANFSASGLKRQDTDVIVIESARRGGHPCRWRLNLGRRPFLSLFRRLPVKISAVARRQPAKLIEN